MLTKRFDFYIAFLIFVFGAALIIITPYGANTDEETHVARIWEMSSGHLLPNTYFNRGPLFPSIFLEISYRQQVNPPVINFQNWRDQMTRHIDWSVMDNYLTRSTYFPTLYLFQAFIMGITGRLFDFPVLIIVYLLRFVSLITYTLLVFAAVRIIPFGKWIIGATSLFPTNLIQASSISPDAINIGLPLLFFAWIMKLKKNETQINQKNLLVLFFLTISMFTLKPNMVVLTGFLFLLPQRAIENWRNKIFLFSSVFFGLFIFLGYYFLTTNTMVLRTDIGLNPFGQFQSLFQNPLIFANVLEKTLASHGITLIKQAIGMTGYNYWQLPMIIYYLSIVVIVFAFFCEPRIEHFSLRERIIITVLCFLYIMSVFIAFYLFETIPGSNDIGGLQGRYFTPIIPILLLVFLINKRVEFPSSHVFNYLLALNPILLIGALFLSFYTPCGNAWISNQICSLPKYKNWDPPSNQSFQLTNQSQLTQTFIAKCDHLQQLKIWVNSNNQTSNSVIDFILLDNKSKVLRSTSINSSEIPKYGWLLITFDAVNDSRNMDYSFIVLSNAIETENGLNIGYTKTNEYAEGTMEINNQVLPGDLVFQYGCKNNMFDRYHKTVKK